MTLTPNRVETSAGAVAGFGDFPATAPAANPVFYRTYSRKTPSGRESWSQVGARNLEGLRQLGNLNDAEVALLARMQAEKKLFPPAAGSGSVAPAGSSSPKTSRVPTTAHPPTWWIGKPLV